MKRTDTILSSALLVAGLGAMTAIPARSAAAAEPPASSAAGLAAQERARTLATELVRGVIDGQLRQLEENGLGDRPIHADILVLRMLNDNDGRAIHFSRTSADLAEELGLGNYVVMQGHVRRVMPDSVVAGTNGIARVPGEGYVNVELSKQLWDEMRAPAALVKKGDWVDAPSRGIPYLVVTTGLATAEGLLQQGRTAEADKIIGTTRDVAVAMRFGEIAANLPTATTPVPASDSAAKTPVPVRTP